MQNTTMAAPLPGNAAQEKSKHVEIMHFPTARVKRRIRVWWLRMRLRRLESRINSNKFDRRLSLKIDRLQSALDREVAR